MLEIAWTFYIKVGFTLIAFILLNVKNKKWLGRYGWSLISKATCEERVFCYVEETTRTLRTTHRFVKSSKINGTSIKRVLILIRYTVPNTVFFYFY